MSNLRVDVKLTILDPLHQPFFQVADFADFVDQTKIELVRLKSHEPFDGTVFRQVPPDTTHLVTWYADRLGPEELKRLPLLRYVGLAFTGWWDKYFDQALLRERGIVVTNNPHYAPNAVAEAVIAALLFRFRLLNQLPLGSSSFEAPVGRELSGKKIGILGLGRIGRRVAEIASGMGLKPQTVSARTIDGVQRVSQAEFFETSDILTLHVPKAAGIVVSAADLRRLPPRTTIVNSSGAENIDGSALKRFLTENLAASYLFLAKPTETHFAELSDLTNCCLFPLFSSRTEEAEQIRKSVTVENLRKFLAENVLDCRVI